MLREAIYHRPKGNFAYAYSNELLHIRIQTKKNDVDMVTLNAKDPFHWGEFGMDWVSVPMKKIGSNQLFDFWQAEMKPLHRRMEYYFEISDKTETVYMTERGFIEKKENLRDYFKFPFLNNVDVFKAPEWVKDTVWYQIFPERFANGNPKLNPKNAVPWGSEEPARDNFFGGDLEGVIQNLDHLSDLGVTGIYFTPIFKASTNHKYDTTDYMQIDPQFGTEETLKELVQECHKRGIKVMLDAVFNHCGYYFEPFQDVLKNGEKSRYKDWFHIKSFPVEIEPKPNYDTFAFTHMMPKLNTENKEVKEYLLKVAKYWIEKCDIDGWRLDVANEVDHAFWREFRNAVKEIKPETYILGEVWNDSLPWLQGDQFDAVMNYPFTNLALDLIAKETINVREFKNGMEELYYKYPKNVNEVAFNLLGSHDTARLLNIANMNKDKVKLLMLLMLTTEGSPCIYYGDEIGLDGEYDPGCRKCMVWDKNSQDRDLYNFIKKIIQIRKEYKSITHGMTEFIENDDILMFNKTGEKEDIIVLINPKNEKAGVELGNQQLQELLINGEVNKNSIVLNKLGFAIFKKNK